MDDTNLKERIRWGLFTPRQRIGLLLLALCDAALLLTAHRDLSRRPPEKLRGSKPLWRALIFVDFLGPLAYFILGRKR